MTDELRDALSAAYDKAEETTDAGQGAAPERIEPEAPEGAGETEAQRAERTRDEAGRFAKEADKADGKDKPREKLTLKPKEAKDAAQKPERQEEGQAAAAKAVQPENRDPGRERNNGQGPAAPGAAAQGDPILPPPHWPGNSKVSWEKLPYPVKQALSAEFEQLAPVRAIVPAIQHYAPLLQQRYGGNVVQGVASVLQLYDNAVNRPLDFIRDFCQQFNIDPQSLSAASGSQVQTGSSEGPQYVTREELAAINERSLAEYQQRLAAQQIQTEIESFGATRNPDGNLAYPYFNDVKQIMGTLFATGQAKTLHQAYQDAVYALPAARQHILAAEQERQAADRRRAAETAKQAAATVTGAPGHRGSGQPQSETVGDTLSRAWEKAVSGACA